MMLHNYRYFIYFILLATAPASASMHDQQPVNYNAILNRPEYKELEAKFGRDPLVNTLSGYEQRWYGSDQIFQQWSAIANMTIGSQYVEEQRRYFLVNVMLHKQTNIDGLNILHNCFNNSSRKYGQPTGERTPQGHISTQIESDSYNKAMKVSNDIRSKIFVNGISPLVLVGKVDGELSPAIKWSLYKVGATIAYIISLYLKRDKKNEKEERHKENHLDNFLIISDKLAEIEKEMIEELEKSFPILRTHTIKSLVDDKIWWLYDRSNWIKGGSAFCMLLLAYGLLKGYLPDMHHRIYSVVILR